MQRSSNMTTSTRRTRRGLTERAATLTGSAAGSSNILPLTKHREAFREQPAEVWGSASKGKGKGKIYKVSEAATLGINAGGPMETDESASVVRPKRLPATSSRQSIPIPFPTTSSETPSRTTVPSSTYSSRMRKRTIDGTMGPPPEHVPLERKRRKTVVEAPSYLQHTTALPEAVAGRGLHSEEGRTRRSSRQALPPASPTTSDSVSTTSLSAIKRVKLIVRRPPPLISHPAQRPRPLVHGGDLSSFLTSFTLLDESGADGAPIHQARIRHEASVREQVSLLKRGDRFFFSAWESRADQDAIPNNRAITVPHSDRDAWHYVVESAVAKAEERMHAYLSLQIATSVAGKITTYWDSIAAKQDKARALEHKRLRHLAKATIKMVVDEWKKAVYVCIHKFWLLNHANTEH
jgi:helicase SWR1